MRRANLWLATAKAVAPPSPAVRDAVLRAARRASERRGRSPWPRAFAAAAVALVLVVGGFWFGFGRTSVGPGASGRLSEPAPPQASASAGEPSGAISICNGAPFAPPRLTPTGSAGSTPWDLALADFNEDGIQDAVVVTKDPGGVGVMLGDGSGGFSQPRPFTPNAPNPLDGATFPSIRAGDITGDGHADAIITNDVAGLVVIYAGDAIGGHRSPESVISDQPKVIDVGGQPRDVAVGQFGGRAARDLAVADAAGNVQVVYDAGTANVTMGPARPVAGAPDEIAVADLDRDRRDDIVLATDFDRGLVVVKQAGDGSLGNPLALQAPASSDVDLVDLNRDGHLDAVLGNGGSDSVAVLLGDGAGSFGAPSVYPLEEGSPGSTATLDVDLDGDVDIVANDTVTNDLAVLVGDGTGRFEVAGRLPGGDGPTGLAVSDLDRDGRVDVVTSNANGNSVGSFRNTCPTG
jgi:hypothetical protein